MFTKSSRYLMIAILLLTLVFIFQAAPALGAIPNGNFQVNDGTGYVNQSQVTLNFSNASEVNAITRMRIRNEDGPFSQWIPFQNGASWQLSPGDGPKTITIEMNFLIIESRVFTVSVILDTQPPLIRDIDVRPLTGTSVEVNWRTSEPTFGFIRFNGNLQNFTRNFNPNATRMPDNYTVDHHVVLDNLQPNQDYNVKIEAVDRANNHNTSPDFLLTTRPADQTPPTGSIRINGGAQYTNSPQVNLELNASDDSGSVATMSFSSDGQNWSPEEPFTNSRSYTLSGGFGWKTIYVRFRDQAGNYSSIYSDTITLDNRPLQITDIKVMPISKDTVEIRWLTDKLSLGTVLYNATIRNFSLRTNENNKAFQGNFGTEHRVRINRLKSGKTYYAKIEAVDPAGNHTLSQEFTFTVRPLDKTPPTGAIRINGGAQFTGNPQVNLELAATDDSGLVASMSFSSNGQNWSPEEPYTNTRSYTLTGGDGRKTIYVRFRDQAGNYSQAYSDIITLDTQPPQILNINVVPVSNDTVEIQWQTDQPCYGTVVYNADIHNYAQRSNDNRSLLPGSFGTDHRMRLDHLQPGRVYYAKIEVIDRAGNHGLSQEFSFSTRQLDQTPPSGSIRINGGAGFTNNPQVNLQLAANDNESGVASMSFSNDGRNWSPDEPFRSDRNYTLLGGDGRKTVYVRFRDQAGNYSQTYSDIITMDTQPPQILNINVVPVSNDIMEIQWQTDQPCYGTVVYNADIHNYAQRSNDNRSLLPGSFGTDHRMRLDHLQPGRVYYAKIEVIDRAGNHGLSQEFSFSTRQLDQTPPSGSIRINGGAGFTNNPQINLQLAANDNESGVASMSFSNDGRNWSPDEPFRSDRNYTLLGSDGQKTVFVRYRDQAGNYSQAYSDNILLDAHPPLISNVTVNQLSMDTVEIHWHTDKPTFGLVQYNAEVRNYSLRSNDNHNDFQGNYGTDHVIRINRLQPGRVYYGRIDAVDRAGNHNLSPEFNFSTRQLDQTPPTGSIRINGGAGFTNNPQVNLQLSANDNESGIASMSFSNDGRNWSPEEPFRAEKAYTLMGGEGQRTVFVRYRDQAGNYSQAYSDSIQIDNRPPQINNVTVNQLSGDTVEIRWRTDEPTFGLVQYNADVRNYSLRSNDNHGDFQGNYGTDHVIRINRLQLGRVYYGRIDAVDRAGNHSQSPEFSFNIPVGPVATQQPQQPPQRPQQPPQSSGINVALKTNGVSTETFPKTGTPDAVIDGDNSTYWQFQIKPPEQGFLGIPLYWQVNFNQKYHLQKIKLTMETDTRFSIQYSRDGKWQLLKSVDKDFQNSNKFEFNLDIETNAIRIVWPWGHVKLYEVEVYN